MFAIGPARTQDLGAVLAIHFSRLDSVLQRTTLVRPSGHPSNSAMRVKPAFSCIPALGSHGSLPGSGASTTRLRDEGSQQCARVTASPICLIDPHLFKFESA